MARYLCHHRVRVRFNASLPAACKSEEKKKRGKYNFLLLTKDVLNVKQFHINPFGRIQSVIHKSEKCLALTQQQAFLHLSYFNSVCASLRFYLYFKMKIITIICYTNSLNILNAMRMKMVFNFQRCEIFRDVV